MERDVAHVREKRQSCLRIFCHASQVYGAPEQLVAFCRNSVSVVVTWDISGWMEVAFANLDFD